MQDDLNRLVKKPPAEVSLKAAGTPAAIRAKTGLERKQAGTVQSEEVTAQSTDGLFTFIVRVVKG
jgi:hypothetical protein